MTGSSTSGSEVRPAVVVAAVAGVLSAWIAAGSTGLLAAPLRIAATWLALAVAVGAVWPGANRRALLPIAATAMLLLPLAVAVHPVHEVLLVVAVLALLAAWCEGVGQRVLLICAFAALVLAIYRFALVSIPAVWLAGDAVGFALGYCAATITGKPLQIGATFAGLDFLVLMAAFYAAWLCVTAKPRAVRAIWAGAAILLAHGTYLVVLSFALDLAEWLPTFTPPEFQHPYVPPDWDWAAAVRQLLPWNVPVVAAVVHAVVIVAMLRWATWARADDAASPFWFGRGSAAAKTVEGRRVVGYGLLAVAVLLPTVTGLWPARSNLAGKKIVAYQHGHLDWVRPQHDAYGQESAGMYGMLPLLVQSQGGQLKISPDLSAKDLRDSDVLVLLHPAGEMPRDVRERIWDYVRGGGSLLVVAEASRRDGDLRSSFNEVLDPTAMVVRDDVAISETGDWQHASDALAHPATSVMNGQDDHFFSDTGASIRIAWPAWPLVVGRWGWSDPGSDAVMTDSYRFELGEKLGDLTLAAEQSMGKGTVVVLGDSVSLTNEGSVRGYRLTGRLLSYLAHRSASPFSAWRQVLSVVLCLGLLVLAVLQFNSPQIGWSVLLLSVSLAVCHGVTRYATRVVPDGRIGSGGGERSDSKLAYIDASHVEAFSEANWGFDATNGLALTLMRQGYVTLQLPEVTSERLNGAAVVVSIAPARRFSAAEQSCLRRFVQGGGILICTTGAEEAAASQSLLRSFGLDVPISPVPTGGDWREPEPVGQLRTLFLDAEDYGKGDYQVGVTFHAAWPVRADAGDTEVLVYGDDDTPLVICRNVGQGKVVLVGDTGFAMNKNLEYIGGQPFDGRYENAHFWRWLISRITDGPEWFPPPPPEPSDSADDESEVQP